MKTLALIATGLLIGMALMFAYFKLSNVVYTAGYNQGFQACSGQVDQAMKSGKLVMPTPAPTTNPTK